MARKMNPEQFVAHLEKYKVQVRENVDRLLRAVIFECIENVVVGGEYSPGTPVDTGFARAAWWVSLDGQGGPPQLPQGEPGTHYDTILEDLLIDLVDFKAGSFVRLNNNTVYIIPLEYGHSQQAPVGMVRLTSYAVHAMVEKHKQQMGLT